MNDEEPKEHISEEEFDVLGVKAGCLFRVSADAKNVIIEIASRDALPSLLVEYALYDVAHKVAHRAGIVETMLKIKRDIWT